MNVVLAFPVLAALLGSLVAVALHRRVAPRFAAPAVAVAALALTAGLAATAGFYALASVVPADSTGWCRELLGHDVHPNPVVGIASGIVAFLGLARAGRWWWRYRRTLRELPGGTDAPLLVLDRPEPIAYAHPGGAGTVVVSKALLARLTHRECLVVLAHERAHLDRHHARFLVVGELAAAGCPLAAPLARAVRWCTERAADEDTAALVGDRRLVATTIAKAAMSTAPAGVARVSGSTVVARVEALLSPAPRRSPGAGAALATGVAVALAGTAFQAHHLVEIVLHSR